MSTAPILYSPDGPEDLVLDPVEQAVADIAAGRPVVVVDDENRENEGDLVIAAEKATEEIVAFMMTECRGLICAPMEGEELDRLRLPQMVDDNTESMKTAFTVSVDAGAAHGVTTGAIVEIAGEDGRMLRLPELIPFARKHGLTIISIEDLIAYRRSAEPTVRREAEVRLPTKHGEFTAYGYRSTVDGVEHIALVHGEIGDGEDVLVRVHSECLTGDVFGSQRCDCGPQLDASLDRIQAEGRGVVVYLRGHEGRGIGLMSKLRAYELQERGRDTLDANLELGLPADARDYGAGAQILADLGVRAVRLLTNNPDKSDALERHGITVTGREPMPVQAGEHNLRYLRTKRDRMGHDLPWLDTTPVSTCGNQ